MEKVSIIIPGRCEKYFQQTVDSVLESAVGDIEVIAVVDGYDSGYSLIQKDDRVKIICLKKSIGQRAAYNLGIKESTGKYVMKIDAHALVSPGFDKALKSYCPDKTVVLPEMRRLDVRKWESKPRGHTHFMYFATDLFCYYWRSYRKRKEAKVEYPEVMTGQGSCWFTTREWNDYIGLLDEGVGSWGKVGIEISLRTWLCGGRQIVNKNAWQAHYFRLSDGGFPYPLSGRQVRKAKNYVIDNYFFQDKVFENQVRPFRWLIEKFAPVSTWEVYLADGYKKNRIALYYSHGGADETLLKAARKNLTKAAAFIPIISVTNKPIDLGQNIVRSLDSKKVGYEDMYERILAGAKAAPDGATVYLCEHDVFYHPSHFLKIPRDKGAFYFNKNRYYLCSGQKSYLEPRKNGRAWSQCVSSKKYLIEKMEKGLAYIRENGRPKLGYRYFYWRSEKPNVDIRHGENLSGDSRLKKGYMSGSLTHTVFNIAHWGSPKHFASKTKYKGVMRWDIIQHLIDLHHYQRYLEIGVKNGTCFKHIRCVHKDGIDPQKNKATYKMTSDEFFEFIPENQKYDIIFIDGLHESQQVMRDIENSMKRLLVGGTIVLHDCYPKSEKDQLVPKSDVKNKSWNGDVWKAFIQFRLYPDLSAFVVDCDSGVGIIRDGHQVPIKLPVNLEYEDFEKNKKEWLNLISPYGFKRAG